MTGKSESSLGRRTCRMEPVIEGAQWQQSTYLRSTTTYVSGKTRDAKVRSSSVFGNVGWGEEWGTFVLLLVENIGSRHARDVQVMSWPWFGLVWYGLKEVAEEEGREKRISIEKTAEMLQIPSHEGVNRRAARTLSNKKKRGLGGG